jgi:starch phosphorylase
MRRPAISETDGNTTGAPSLAPTPTAPRRTGSLSLMSCLQDLACNLWWTWHPEVVSLFRDLDPAAWRELDHNPITLLARLTPEQIEERASALTLHSQIHDAHRQLCAHLQSQDSWGDVHAGVLRARPVAYFSAEFGLHESLPIYSGGLGVLAGDHVKSASDLDVPLVAVGLFYDQGYFLQRLDGEGRQLEEYIDLDVQHLALEAVAGSDGAPLHVSIETRTGTIWARVWRVAVGRVTLLLLDCDCEGNGPDDRRLAARLYGGDLRTRIRQELVLGVGGVRALRAVGIEPGVLHLNEGHSAFATLEMVRHVMARDGLRFEDACRRVAALTCFTTHTPVPAGHDRFPPPLVEEHLGPLRDALGRDEDELLGLGRVDPQNNAEPFCMTVLALRLSRQANAVSTLHGGVSREMWHGLWPQRSAEEVPIGHVTNGVHVHSWLAPQMRQLYARHMGIDWVDHSAEPETWRAIDDVDDGDLWDTHQVLKARLLAFVRRRVALARARRREPAERIAVAERLLEPDALTIGFARRFATYKRATLLLSDLERLRPLLARRECPIQLIFAGKAHPHDEPGKWLLQQIATLCRESPFAERVVFVEDYDINLGRHLVQGVDLWLNTPRRPLEASGTSGQKVVLNGGLNLSVLDGWWAEAFDGLNGFAIGMGEAHADPEVQDQRDAEHLYQALEREVVPMFYARDADDLPRAWIARMKRSIRSLGWRFNADRMVMDYVRYCYLPAAGGVSCRM